MKTAKTLGPHLPNLAARPSRRGDRIGSKFAALHMSACDAVDGSSTGTEVPWMWVLLRPPRFGGATHASGQDRKSTRLNSSHTVISYAVFCSRAHLYLHSFPTRRSSDLGPHLPNLAARPSRRGDRIGSKFAALHMSACDAVDGSSTGTEVPWMWVLLRPPRFGGATHASG